MGSTLFEWVVSTAGYLYARTGALIYYTIGVWYVLCLVTSYFMSRLLPTNIYAQAYYQLMSLCGPIPLRLAFNAVRRCAIISSYYVTTVFDYASSINDSLADVSRVPQWPDHTRRRVSFGPVMDSTLVGDQLGWLSEGSRLSYTKDETNPPGPNSCAPITSTPFCHHLPTPEMSSIFDVTKSPVAGVKISLPTFSGNERDNPREFLLDLVDYAKIKGITVIDILHVLPQVFTGQAKVWFAHLRQTKPNQLRWEVFQRCFEDEYMSEAREHNILVQVSQTKQGANEDVLAFERRLLQLNHTLRRPLDDKVMLGLLLKSLQPRYKDYLSPLFCSDLTTFRNEARRLSLVFQDRTVQGLESQHNPGMLANVPRVRFSPGRKGTCWNCNGTDHYRDNCPFPKAGVQEIEEAAQDDLHQYTHPKQGSMI